MYDSCINNALTTTKSSSCAAKPLRLCACSRSPVCLGVSLQANWWFSLAAASEGPVMCNVATQYEHVS